MALFETHYFSFALKSNITLNVIIPTPASGEAYTDMGTKAPYLYDEGVPVLYLLHGAFGDAFSWLRYSSIERYANAHGIAVVMCSAENSFYQDLPHGPAYKTFFTEELPHFIKSVFPVTKDREKTFIVGLSMGGYGAWYLALSRPDLYAKAASLSGAVDIAAIMAVSHENRAEGNIWDNCFGDLTKLKGSGSDLFALYDKRKAEGCTIPKLFQAVGTEDFLYQANQSARAYLTGAGADLTYEEGSGGHTWEFWDLWIQRVLDWIQES